MATKTSKKKITVDRSDYVDDTPLTEKLPATLMTQEELEQIILTDDGKRLVQLSAEIRVVAMRLNLPVTVQLGGVAPFGAELIERVKINAFQDGRFAEREAVIQRLRTVLFGA